MSIFDEYGAFKFVRVSSLLSKVFHLESYYDSIVSCRIVEIREWTQGKYEWSCFKMKNEILLPRYNIGFKISHYSRLSLSSSPGDSLKYFEISVISRIEDK